MDSVGGSMRQLFRCVGAAILAVALSATAFAQPGASVAPVSGVTQGRPFEVAYQGPLGPGDQIRVAWVGSPADDYVTAAAIALDGAPVSLTAPVELGLYELRYWEAETGLVLARLPLILAPLVPTLDAPERVAQGGAIVVAWTADPRIAGQIELADPNKPLAPPLAIAQVVRTEPTVTLIAPIDPGRYEIRFIREEQTFAEARIRGSDADRVLARRAIDVTSAVATLAIVGDPVAGAGLTVEWTGPGAPEDQIRLATPEMTPYEFIDARLVGAAAPVTFAGPLPAGSYELRYWSAALWEVVGTTPVTLAEPSATLDAPGEVAGGATVTIAWDGPANIGDRIAISVVDAPADFVLAVARVSFGGVPVRLGAPVQAGTYELRYLAADGAVIARRPIAVTAADASIAPPGTVEAGSAFTVAWSGPAGPFDELRITLPAGPDDEPFTATRVTAGVAATLVAPDRPGTYLIRYWSASSATAIASAPLEVVCANCAPAEPTPDVEELRP
ncbi:MAG: hypothetical protein KIS96_04045 [Bauldia sp.]|nr:hypothetical protein [Bauldia sp.]